MIKEAVQYLVTLGETKKNVEIIDHEGRRYTDRSIHAMTEPVVSAIKVSTLSGLCDLIGNDCKVEGFSSDHYLVHVVDHEHVQVIAKRSNHWKQREVLVDCTPEETKQFVFGQFVPHEQFTIGLLSQFKDSGDREHVLKISSNVTNEAVVVSADDGISQRLTVNQSVALKSEVVVRTVKLAPWRTFNEVEQPTSEFILRAKNDNNTTKLALFESDGGRWKLEAIENIARYLRQAAPEKTTVIS